MEGETETSGMHRVGVISSARGELLELIASTLASKLFG